MTTALTEGQRVRIKGAGVTGTIAVRRQARIANLDLDDNMEQYRDFGPPRLVDSVGHYAVSVRDGVRWFYVFARADELEAA